MNRVEIMTTDHGHRWPRWPSIGIWTTDAGTDGDWTRDPWERLQEATQVRDSRGATAMTGTPHVSSGTSPRTSRGATATENTCDHSFKAGFHGQKENNVHFMRAPFSFDFCEENLMKTCWKFLFLNNFCMGLERASRFLMFSSFNLCSQIFMSDFMPLSS